MNHWEKGPGYNQCNTVEIGNGWGKKESVDSEGIKKELNPRERKAEKGGTQVSCLIECNLKLNGGI